MPWTMRDVERFKKGLSDSQKRRWVRIANDALRRCVRGGGSESSCAASAIRQANGIVGNSKKITDMETIKKVKKLQVFFETNASYEVRNEIYEGREHVVVPVVMMVEGVHSGSRGPLFHSAEELGRIPASFDGIPVTIQHPQDKGGRFISANSPEILRQYSVGRIFNSYFEDGKLKAEAWIDIQRITAISPEALQDIADQHPLEISLGMFNDEEPVEGTWNGEEYIAIARNHRPDHLALLPGGVGACSWKDGCGVRVNQSNKSQTKKKGGIDVSVNKKDEKKFPELFETLKELNNKGFSVRYIECLADEGFKTLVRNAQQKLDRMDDDMKMHFLEEMYADYMIYEVRRREGESELYRREYSTNEDGSIEFTSDPVRVNRKIEYMVQKMKRTKFNNNEKKEDNMSDKVHACSACEEKIKALIANEKSPYAEEDREWLVPMSQEQIDKIAKPFEVAEKKDEPKPETKKSPEVTTDAKNDLSDEDLEALEYGKTQMKNRRTELIQIIQTNAKDTWTKEELAEMQLPMLEKVAKTVTPIAADYSANGGGTSILETNQELLLPAGIELEESK